MTEPNTTELNDLTTVEFDAMITSALVQGAQTGVALLSKNVLMDIHQVNVLMARLVAAVTLRAVMNMAEEIIDDEMGWSHGQQVSVEKIGEFAEKHGINVPDADMFEKIRMELMGEDGGPTKPD